MTEINEIWKDCKGYEGLYQVSNLGRVWNIKLQRYLKGSYNKDGYIRVNLTAKNGKCKTESVHRLVALAFIPNPKGLPQVNHIDENKENNCVDNLEWTSIKDNANHGTRNKRISKANSISVYCFELDKTFYGAREAERELGINHSSISKACRGKQKTAGGYLWEYYNGEYKSKY